MSTAEQAASDEQIEQGLPKPSGYKLLIALPKVEDTYGGGILKADITKSREESATIIEIGRAHV